MLLTLLAPTLIITTLLAILLHRIKQPLVISYIIAGILLGPQLFNLITDSSTLEAFSQAGIIFLLFIVGIHLNPKVLKEVGATSLIAGIGQVVFTTIIGYGLALLLGFDPLSSLFIAIALTFSSTIIIMKLIADKKELNKLYAKISIGFLLVQDIVATIILILMPMFSPTNSSASLGYDVARLLSTASIIIISLFLISRYLLPKIMAQIADSMELLFLTSISWGLGIALLFQLTGLSIEVGALIAGISLSTSPFAEEISSRLRPLRDFFLVVFFILLGSHLEIADLTSVLIPSLILSAFVLVGNPTIVYTILMLLGYSRKVSFKAGLSVAQISEFSLILIASATILYPLSPQTTALVTLVGIITIAASTYLILYADPIFERLDPILARLPLKTRKKPDDINNHATHQLYWFGYNPLREHILNTFKDKKYHITVIDYDPAHTQHIEEQGLSHIFGDASDAEFLAELDWSQVDVIISMIPDEKVNQLIISHAKNSPSNPTIIVTSTHHHTIKDYLTQGASHVLLPFHITATYIKKLI